MLFFLIGFMGSGKSYVGRQIAEHTGMPFIDLDTWIETAQQRDIPSIFEQDGEAFFRKIERTALHEMTQFETAVIACGGGTPCFFDNMTWMNQQGVTIYLETSVAILVKRLKPERAHRPLLQKMDDTQLQQFIENKLKERTPYYSQSQVIHKINDNQQNAALELIKNFNN